MMKIEITFKQMDSSDSVKSHIEEKMSKLERYGFHAMAAHVTFHHERNHHQAEIDFSSKEIHARGEAAHSDVYGAFEEALEKVEKTLRRFHDKKVRNRGDARA
ncbi:MAG: ribosome-associated translation inhibitor RaiA [Bdellovibrionota bacterium]